MAVAQVVTNAVTKAVAMAASAMAMAEDVVVVVAEEVALATVEDVADAATMALTGAGAVFCMRCCCYYQHIFSLFRRPPLHLPSTMPFSSSLAYRLIVVFVCASPGLDFSVLPGPWP